MIDFNQSAKNVMLARKNYGSPKTMLHRINVSSQELVGKTITIEDIVISIKPKRDNETKEPILNKDGKQIYQPYAYVAYDGDKYFVSKSGILIEQIESISDTQLRGIYEQKEISIDTLNGETVSIGTEKVPYRGTGKDYDQIIFKSA